MYNSNLMNNPQIRFSEKEINFNYVKVLQIHNSTIY